MKNMLEGLNRFQMVEEIMSKLRVRLVEMIQREKIREKKNWKKWIMFQWSIGDIKYTSLSVIGVPEGEERERGRKVIWRNQDWPLHDFDECINPHAQEAQQTSV